jgi:outer membrane protein assembly factor BamB
MTTRTPLLAAALVALAVPALRGDDWPQHRGPNRDGVSREKGLRQEWPKGGPPLLWTFADAGVGYSGPAVVGDRLYLAGGRGDDEFLFALDLTAPGGPAKPLWSARIGPLFTWNGNGWNRGPNVSPTVDGDRVYSLGGFGDLVCVGAADGKERWRTNLPRDLGGEVNPIGGGLEDPTPLGWGYAGAPLVDGDALVCVPGGKQGLLAALDKNSGRVLWRSKDATDQAPYASPIVVEFGGVRQYVQVTNRGVLGVAARDGKVLWSYERKSPFGDVVTATPVFHDGCVFATVGFGQGCDLVRVTPRDGTFSAEVVYATKELQSRDGGVVLVGDHLFGFSEHGGWVCQEFKTGKVAWSEKKALGRGSVTAADGRLYCCAETGGAVALVEPSAAGWTERGRLQLPRESRQRLPRGGLWTHPVVANGRLYVRDQELLFCYDLRP